MSQSRKFIFTSLKARFIAGFAFLTIILFLCFSYMRPPRPEDVSATMGRGSRLSVKRSARAYFSDHLYQEAAWEYKKIGEQKLARQALDTLRQIMLTRPVHIEVLGKAINVSKTYLMSFNNGVRAVFKVEKSDSLGPVRREAAVYELDQLLGFDFTPMTLVREVEFPDGAVRSGALMYYVRECQSAMEQGAEKTDKLHLFDAIVGNSDRHENNWLIRDTGEMVAIDHNRTFRHDNTGFAVTYWHTEIRSLKKPGKLGKVYQRFKRYPENRFREAIADFVEPNRVELFLETRREIIKQVEALKRRRRN